MWLKQLSWRRYDKFYKKKKTKQNSNEKNSKKYENFFFFFLLYMCLCVSSEQSISSFIHIYKYFIQFDIINLSIFLFFFLKKKQQNNDIYFTVFTLNKISISLYSQRPNNTILYELWFLFLNIFYNFLFCTSQTK